MSNRKYRVILFIVSCLLLVGCSKQKESQEIASVSKYEESVVTKWDIADTTNNGMWVYEDQVYVMKTQHLPGDQGNIGTIYYIEDGKLIKDTKWNPAFEKLQEVHDVKANYQIRGCGTKKIYVLVEKENDTAGFYDQIYCLEQNGSYSSINISQDYVYGQIYGKIYGKVYGSDYNKIINIIVDKNENIYVLVPYSILKYDWQKEEMEMGIGYTSNRNGTNWAVGSEYIYENSYGHIYQYKMHGNYVCEWNYDELVSSDDLFCADEEDNIYVINRNGIACKAKEGSIWEIIYEEKTSYFEESEFEMEDMLVNDGIIYVSGKDLLHNEQVILQYTCKEESGK